MGDNMDPLSIRQHEDDAATRGFFGGLLLGILLGVVLTLVFAPRRGDETRAAVAGAANELKAKAVDLVGRSGELAGSDVDAAIERDINVREVKQ